MDCLFEIKQKYHDKKILILGLGIQDGGFEALNFFYQLGAKVRVSDLKDETKLESALLKIKRFPDIKYELGRHSDEFIEWANVIVRNPGIPYHSQVLALARKLGKEVIMPSAFLLKNCRFKSIGITGTRGKSTTTNIIFQILKTHLPGKTHLAGNLPKFSPFKLLPILRPSDTVVLELSSWELQGCRDNQISPDIAVLTNIYPDHLNFYEHLEEYSEDKMQIFSHQKPTDFLVTLESTYNQLEKQIKKYLRSQLVVVSDNYYQGSFDHLLGDHNRQNASLALKVAELMKISQEQATKTITSFVGLPFRLEYLGTLKSARIYNDSTSTTPIAGIKALQALKKHFEDREVILVAGGNEKKLPFEEWLVEANAKSGHIFLLPGTFSDLVKNRLDKQKLTLVSDLNELFTKLEPYLSDQHLILFSPSATSFATFKNEFDRGEQFNEHYQRFLVKYGA